MEDLAHFGDREITVTLYTKITKGKKTFLLRHHDSLMIYTKLFIVYF